jgi:DNA-binding response OmpR family regulator
MNEKKRTVLVVEDDESLRMALGENLESAGYDVLLASDGPAGLSEALSRHPALIVLDVMLPQMSGYEICRKLRDRGIRTPVLMLTARQDEFDKLHGFEMGADDYVTKPFSIKELLARIQALMRRGGGLPAGAAAHTFGDCILDMDARVLRRKKRRDLSPASSKGGKGSKDGGGGKGGKKEDAARRAAGQRSASDAPPPADEWEEVPLTRTEFDLLAYLYTNEGKALSRDQVMNDVWGMEYYGTQRSLDSFVAALRSKIERDPPNPRHILTVHGVGYKFFRNPE